MAIGGLGGCADFSTIFALISVAVSFVSLMVFTRKK